MHRIILPAAILAVVSCKTTPDDKQAAASASPEQATRPEATTAKASPEPELSPADLRWGTHSVEELGMTVPILGGIEVKAGEMGESKYVRQTKKPLMTAVWYGHGRSLEAWRAGYEGYKGAILGEEQATTICGRSAKRQELSLAASRVAMRPAAMQLSSGMAGAGSAKPSGEVNHPSSARPQVRDTPARTQVAIEMIVKDTPVVSTWTIETDKREAFAAAEKHFFDSLCGGK